MMKSNSPFYPLMVRVCFLLFIQETLFTVKSKKIFIHVFLDFLDFILRKSLCKFGIISSLNVWQNSSMKASRLGDFALGRFGIINLTFKIDIKLFRFALSLSLCSLWPSRNLLIGCWIFQHKVVHTFLCHTLSVWRTCSAVPSSVLHLTSGLLLEF